MWLLLKRRLYDPNSVLDLRSLQEIQTSLMDGRNRINLSRQKSCKRATKRGMWFDNALQAIRRGISDGIGNDTNPASGQILAGQTQSFI